MRKLAVLFASALTIAAFGAAPAAQAAAPPRVHIDKHASTIFQYDPSPSGDGTDLDPATTVTAVFVNCPAGQYQLRATLKQHGQSMYWATQGRGSDEFSCDGTTKRIRLPWAFAGDTLRAGKARAAFALYRAVCEDDLCSTDENPTLSGHALVRIPGRN
jgi:hypothetical protein